MIWNSPFKLITSQKWISETIIFGENEPLKLSLITKADHEIELVCDKKCNHLINNPNWGNKKHC